MLGIYIFANHSSSHISWAPHEASGESSRKLSLMKLAILYHGMLMSSDIRVLVKDNSTCRNGKQRKIYSETGVEI